MTIRMSRVNRSRRTVVFAAPGRVDVADYHLRADVVVLDVARRFRIALREPWRIVGPIIRQW